MEILESKKRLPEPAVKLIIWCAPTLALLLIGLLLRGWIPSLDSIASYMLVSVFSVGLTPNQFSLPALIPLLAVGLIITRMIFVLRSQRKAVVKAILIAVWLIILIIVSFFNVFLPRTLHFQTKTDARNTFEARTAAMVYPENTAVPLEFETASSAAYHEVINMAVISESHAYTLLCDYGEAEYKDALASLEDRCGFRTEPLGTGCFDEDRVEIMIEPYAMIGDDRFRILWPEDENTFWFYNRCLLIMNNDAKKQIAYIIFYDNDLDYAEDLAAFINEYCGWRYIR